MPNRAVTSGLFDAMEVQRVSVHQALYEADDIEGRWQMPSMQMHTVETYFVTRLGVSLGYQR